MRERPILFSSPMIRAILAGTKSQTRRVVKCDLNDEDHVISTWDDGHSGPGAYLHNVEYPEDGSIFLRCPYGAAGDTLWVRETWAHDADSLDALRAEHDDLMAPEVPHGPYYRADGHHEASGLRWRPSIHMPRWASRITLPVTAIRAERLQEISEADARAEGVTPRLDISPDQPIAADVHGRTFGSHPYTAAYAMLWDAINGPEAWVRNPWVFVIDFTVSHGVAK